MVDPRGMDLHADLAKLTRLAQRDLRRGLAGARNVDHARAILNDLLPDLIDTYGEAAAAAAADWYDELRDQVRAPGRFTAVVAGLDDPGVKALTGWAAKEATSLQGFTELALGGYTRRILKYGRSTVTKAAIRDPAANGWMRQGDGSSCPFCDFLIGRGAVYTEATSRFGSHDHCGCVAVPAFRGKPLPVLLDKDGTRLTVSDRASRTDDEKRAVDNERIRSWIEQHPTTG